MSTIVTDDNRNPVQAFPMPASGQTTTITTVAAASTASTALTGGVYRVSSSGAVTIAQGATATATDLPLAANMPEYFYVAPGQTVAAYSVAGGDTVSITRV